MTQDEIIEMAQQCGLIGMRPHLDGIYAEALVAFAKLVAAKALAPVGDEIASIIACRNMLDAQPVHRTEQGDKHA